MAAATMTRQRATRTAADVRGDVHRTDPRRTPRRRSIVGATGMNALHRTGLATVSLLAAALCGPAAAQMDFSGEWPVVLSQDNTDNPHLGEYVGIPLSREAIRRAEVWDASIQSLPEWQCRPHSGVYIKRGPSNLRMWKEIDPASRQI